MRLVFDFIVLGAGMAGVSVADALAGRARVALLEVEPYPGYHATGRSAALFVPSYGSATFTALTRASAAFLSAPPPQFFPHPVLRPRGALYLARADQRERLAQEFQALRAAGGAIELLSVEAARARVPALRPGYAAATSYQSDVADIDVEALFRGFLNRGKAAGVALTVNARVGTPERSQNLWHVPVNGERLCGHVIVNATGAWADQVAAACGAAPLGLRALRRSAAIIDAPPGANVAAWPAVFDIDELFYLKPEAGRLLISPADEEPSAPGDAYADDLAIATAVERIQAALELDVQRVHRTWAGLRTFAPDRDPVIGYDAEVSGFFWCAGQGGYGIQSAPACAQLAAALARHEPIPEAIRAQGVTEAAVRPGRLR